MQLAWLLLASAITQVDADVELYLAQAQKRIYDPTTVLSNVSFDLQLPDLPESPAKSVTLHYDRDELRIDTTEGLSKDEPSLPSLEAIARRFVLQVPPWHDWIESGLSIRQGTATEIESSGPFAEPGVLSHLMFFDGDRRLTQMRTELDIGAGIVGLVTQRFFWEPVDQDSRLVLKSYQLEVEYFRKSVPETDDEPETELETGQGLARTVSSVEVEYDTFVIPAMQEPVLLPTKIQQWPGALDEVDRSAVTLFSGSYRALQ